jgi:PST family polysaccharide transporter
LFSLAICADDVVHVIAGPQWGHAVDILRLLAPAAALQVGRASTDWLMRSQGQADRFFRWTLIDTTASLLSCILGLRWGAIGVATGLATANLVLFLPSFAYAAKGTTIRLMDALEAMLPCFVLMMMAVAAVWVLRHFIAQDWTPFPRVLLTGVTIAATMGCGTFWVYGRSALNYHFLRSEP